MNRKTKEVIKKYKTVIDEKYNVDMDLSDYSRLPFNKVDLENTKPIVKVKRKNAILACCASSFLTTGVVLAIVLPLTLHPTNKENETYYYDDNVIINNTFDPKTAKQVFSYNDNFSRFTLYTGTIDSSRNLLYVSTLQQNGNYKYYFELADYNYTFYNTNDHFPIPEEPFELYFKAYSDTTVFVESTITIK